MREVRPTVAVLKSLPRESFEDPAPLDLIANREYKRLNLYGVKHPLLEDARRRFATGTPDRHKSASKAYRKPVFEVRDRTGAGWRGAVILDVHGDPWLVWAERHDEFHRSIASVPLETLLPTEVEYKLRAREEAARKARDWERGVLKAFVEALRESVRTGLPIKTTVEGTTEGAKARLTVETEHDQPSDDIAEAQDGSSLLTITLRITGNGWGEFERALTRVCLPFLEPDPSRVEPAFDTDGNLAVCLDITHAQVIQLLSDPPQYEAEGPAEVSPPNRLHYVGVDYLVDGFVNGVPLRGVCGVWFVASRSEECGLPICEQCEEEKPAAQAVLNMLQSKR